MCLLKRRGPISCRSCETALGASHPDAKVPTSHLFADDAVLYCWASSARLSRLNAKLWTRISSRLPLKPRFRFSSGKEPDGGPWKSACRGSGTLTSRCRGSISVTPLHRVRVLTFSFAASFHVVQRDWLRARGRGRFNDGNRPSRRELCLP